MTCHVPSPLNSVAAAATLGLVANLTLPEKIFTLAAQLKSLTRHDLILLLSLVFAWSAQLASCAQAPARSPSLDAFRKFALTHEGDVARGARLFADEQRLACSKCHSLDGRASKAGPDLFAVGDKFGRRDLVEAVLVPSATTAGDHRSCSPMIVSPAR